MAIPRHVHNTTNVEDMMQVMGSGQLVTGVTSGTPDAETTFTHTLDRIPRGFMIISKDKAGDFYDGTGHTSTLLKLKNAVATVTFTAWIF